MLHALRLLLVAMATILLATGCVVYEPYPAAPPVFERSWSAAAGAMQDQGVQITAEDRAAGVIQGRRGGIEVTAQIRSQADGSVRVQFDTRGATGQDPGLINRISQGYDRRMGR